MPGMWGLPFPNGGGAGINRSDGIDFEMKGRPVYLCESKPFRTFLLRTSPKLKASKRRFTGSPWHTVWTPEHHSVSVFLRAFLNLFHCIGIFGDENIHIIGYGFHGWARAIRVENHTAICTWPIWTNTAASWREGVADRKGNCASPRVQMRHVLKLLYVMSDFLNFRLNLENTTWRIN